ncbi:hypothetical protein PAECIP111893_01196 [Paenibacillus plantiphilus]|uniref:DinB-like domain-containing protein n=1 Tax=Paenibacillus plantiphilus TaxID=2905650 RepID=A0ABM9SFG9_9BACL|nr:DinB family protein [Paenibacillus plantiphilus]CAH1198977.1 hypothetical protein PAECIP111893_01196 [Paenibacillus plantiphilus]
MLKQVELLEQFEELAQWYAALTGSEQGWRTPIGEGKWCPAEVVAHLVKWDEYLLTTVLPAASSTIGQVEFPDHDTYNAVSLVYARSGISAAELLQEACKTRADLVQELRNLTEEQLFRAIPVNGHTHCPQTNTPYSLGYLIWEFIQHDGHHRKQVEASIR